MTSKARARNTKRERRCPSFSKDGVWSESNAPEKLQPGGEQYSLNIASENGLMNPVPNGRE